MKDVQLPWTCEQGDKIFFVLKWIGLFTFPIMLAWATQTNQIPKSGNESLLSIPPIFSIGLIGSAVGWLSQILWWLTTMSWPSFYCKPKSDYTSQKESTK